MRINEFVTFLENSKTYDEKSRRKTLKKYLASPELYRDIFTPDMSNPDAAVMATKVMEHLSKKKYLKDMAAIIQSEDFKPFQGTYGSTSREKFIAFRSFIALVFASINVASSALMEDGEEYSRVSKDRSERRRMYELKDDIVSKTNAVDQLQLALNRLIKKEVKFVYKNSGLPKDFVRLAICSSPGNLVPEQIPNYLSVLLNSLYQMVEDYPGLFPSYDISEVDWGSFFSYLYGKENLVDVAIYISVEGVNRIDRYHAPEVRYCWDSLTTFALECMEKAPRQSRNNMMDKYIETISTMFANGDRDLRVNMLTIDPDDYPSLSQLIVDKYATMIKDIVEKYK